MKIEYEFKLVDNRKDLLYVYDYFVKNAVELQFVLLWWKFNQHVIQQCYHFKRKGRSNRNHWV